MSKHVFTAEERRRGGIARSSMPSFPEHCSNAFELLKAKRPDCWRWIYKHRVSPHMQAKEVKENV